MAVLPLYSPNIVIPLLNSNIPTIWILACNARTRIMGSTLAYISLTGKRPLAPLTALCANGISIRVDSTYTTMRNIKTVLINASMPPSMNTFWNILSASRLPSPISVVKNNHFGSSPTGALPGPPGRVILNRPVTIDWATPATMNRPTPEPIPHLDTTSSINSTRVPPMNIWTKIINMTRSTPPAGERLKSADNIVARPRSGRIYPPSIWGKDSSTIITNTSNFWAPWKIA